MYHLFPLKDLNCYKINCIARYYSPVKNIIEVQEALNFAKEKNLRIFILGGGWNILLQEGVFQGLVINPENNFRDGLTVGCSSSMDDYIKYVIDLGYANLEIFSGIPGSIGGCTFMNIHYLKAKINQFISEVTVITDTKVLKITFSEMMELKDKFVIWQVKFNLEKTNNIPQVKSTRYQILTHRANRYPDKLTCGCFFSNISYLEGKNKSIGYHAERLGLKEKFKQGDAKIYHKHGNMIVSNGKATSSQILDIANQIKLSIEADLKLKIFPECQIINNVTE